LIVPPEAGMMQMHQFLMKTHQEDEALEP